MNLTPDTLADMCYDVEQRGGSVYVTLAQYMRAYARSHGISLTLVSHLTHIGYLLYTVGKRTAARAARAAQAETEKDTP